MDSTGFLQRMGTDQDVRQRTKFVNEIKKHPQFKASMLQPPKKPFKGERCHTLNERLGCFVAPRFAILMCRCAIPPLARPYYLQRFKLAKSQSLSHTRRKKRVVRPKSRTIGAPSAAGTRRFNAAVGRCTGHAVRARKHVRFARDPGYSTIRCDA
jgi:hypothetical protein